MRPSQALALVLICLLLSLIWVELHLILNVLVDAR